MHICGGVLCCRTSGASNIEAAARPLCRLPHLSPRPACACASSVHKEAPLALRFLLATRR
eukprot:scaffold20365_cov132-Isochrysis_galbana.AAC.2